MSVKDYKGFIETIEILTDKKAIARIKKAKKEIKEGKTISLEAFKRKLSTYK